MFGNPFFSDFDDGYYHRPRDLNQQRWVRAAAAQEEARRRAALEQHYREQERLRQREEYARRLHEHQREQEAYQNELRRRRAVLQDRERQEYMRRANGTTPEQDFNDLEQEDEPIYQLMRGPDGRVYRVQIGSKKKESSRDQNRQTKKKSWQGDSERVPSSKRSTQRKNTIEELESEWGDEEPNSKEVEGSQENMKQRLQSDVDWKGSTSKEGRKTPRASSSSSRTKKGGKKRVTIIVEDASDSEEEDNFSKSPWHNRRPSPGEWMEPVEGYDRLP